MCILKRYVSVTIRGMYEGSGAGTVTAISTSFISGAISAASVDMRAAVVCYIFSSNMR
jgi:hypothetical protein